MKTVTLHVPSLLVGGVAAFALLLSLGAAPQRPIDPVPSTASSRPAARDLVWIEGGGTTAGTYVVPAGKILVLERLTWTSRSTPVRVRIDGQWREWSIQTVNEIAEQRFGNGVPLPTGTTLAVDAPGGGYAWLLGYLADA